MTKEHDRLAAVLRDLERSGLSMAEFCRRQDLPYSSVAAWRSAQRREAGRFIEVVSTGDSAMAARRGCRMIFTRGLRVCLAAEPTDLRRSFEGLVLLVKNALSEDERSSQIFVFTNKCRDRIRLLYWDG